MSYVEDGMLLGVGTGSTVGEFVEVLKARKIRLRGVVSSSRQTSERLESTGIAQLDLNAVGELDLYVDGADEATRSGMLIKGGGAALTPAGRRVVALYREAERKMRAAAAKEIAGIERSLADESGGPGLAAPTAATRTTSPRSRGEVG